MIRKMPGMILTMSSSATEYRQVDRELARSQRRVSGAVNAVLAPNVKICATQVLAGIKQNQAARWKAGLGLTAAQHAGIAAYETLIARPRQVNGDVLGRGFGARLSPGMAATEHSVLARLSLARGRPSKICTLIWSPGFTGSWREV